MKLYYETSLSHHGIKGQKWGVRRFQNEDGSLTPRGMKRYDNRSDVRKEYDDARSNYMKSKIIYRDDRNTAFKYGLRKGLSQLRKGTKANVLSEVKWKRAFDSNENLKTATEQYKQAIKKRNDTYKNNLNEVTKNNTYLENRLYRKRVAKLITDTNMDIKSAKTRSKAILATKAIGAAAVAGVIASAGVYLARNTTIIPAPALLTD